MKQLTLPLLFVLFICCKEENKKTENVEPVKTTKEISHKFDSSYYSKEFLQKLESHKDMKLDGNGIIYEGNRISFPDVLAFSRKYSFMAQNDSLDYMLEVSRINYTTIKYTCTITNRKAKRKVSFTSEADLDPGFVLAAEVDEDSETGTAYGSYEYISPLNNNCQQFVRIAEERDNEGRFRATLSFTCPDFYWGNNIPTLRTRSKKASQ